MPQYRLVYQDTDGQEYLCVRWARSEQDLANIIPLITDSSGRLIPLENLKLIQAQEVEIVTFVQLDLKSWQKVRAKARSKGLKEQKANGAWCLEIRGKSDWMKEDWVKELKVLETNWLS